MKAVSQKRRLKICVVTHDFPAAAQPYRGAPIWQTLGQLREHASLNVLCPVPVCWGVSGIYNQFPQATRSDGLPTTAVPYFSLPRLSHGRNATTLASKLKSVVAAVQPDLILSYWIYPDSCAAIRVGSELGIPVVVGARGSDLKVRERSAAVRRQIEFTVQHADAVLAVSSDLARTACKLGASPRRVHTVINGIDRGIFRPAEASPEKRVQEEPGSKLVFFVGRLVAMKGAVQLVEAIAKLHKAEPGRWRLAIAGEGPQKADLEKAAHAGGVTPFVTLLGKQPAAEIASWMNASDFFCLPSESEGCPNVVQEALACGCPVVATDVGGIPELVNETNGILIPGNDANTIRNGLAEATRRSWDRRAIAAACQRGWEDVARETYQICEGVLDGVRDRIRQ